jgi:DNA mismatch repair protein MutS
MATAIHDQYDAIKRQYPDALLCFRAHGSGYFLRDDGVIAAIELRRVCEPHGILGNFANACMIGDDHLEKSIAILIGRGYKVAVCDQIGVHAR